MDQRPLPVTDLGDDSAAVLGLPRPSTRPAHMCTARTVRSESGGSSGWGR